MNNTNFKLCQGVDLQTTGNVTSAFSVNGENLSGVLSAELIVPTAEAFIRSIKEPIFFFLELPAQNSEDHEVYYLDNCTEKVAIAVLERFGELLANDGVARFGFGSNATDEEIYFEDYQEFSVYLRSPQKLAEKLKKLGIAEKQSYTSLWDILSDDNIGSLCPVEIDAETVFDIPDALKGAGMYIAQEEKQ